MQTFYRKSNLSFLLNRGHMQRLAVSYRASEACSRLCCGGSYHSDYNSSKICNQHILPCYKNVNIVLTLCFRKRPWCCHDI